MALKLLNNSNNLTSYIWLFVVKLLGTLPGSVLHLQCGKCDFLGNSPLEDNWLCIWDVSQHIETFTSMEEQNGADIGGIMQ